MFKKLQKTLIEEVMLGTCDGPGMNNRGYVAMCNAVKHHVELIALELKEGPLPSRNWLA